MTAQPDDHIDWSVTTWKGSRLQQHREFHALSFARKLEIIEDMCEQTRQIIASRQRHGLPYIDPSTGEAIGPRPAAVVREDPPRPRAVGPEDEVRLAGDGGLSAERGGDDSPRSRS